MKKVMHKIGKAIAHHLANDEKLISEIKENVGALKKASKTHEAEERHEHHEYAEAKKKKRRKAR